MIFIYLSPEFTKDFPSRLNFHCLLRMKDKKSQEEIIQVFNSMRNEQRQIAGKTNELQQDLNEHKIVIETLEGVAGDRKCFRMVGGVLVERTVSEVLPALVSNRDKMGEQIFLHFYVNSCHHLEVLKTL